MREVREVTESVKVSPVSSKYVTVQEDEEESAQKQFVEVQPVQQVHTSYQNLSEINYVNNSNAHAMGRVNFDNTEADNGGRINVYREGHAGLASDVHNTYQNLSSANSYRRQYYAQDYINTSS